MREARKNHGLVVVNNRIYAVGGQGAIGNSSSPQIFIPPMHSPSFFSYLQWP